MASAPGYTVWGVINPNGTIQQGSSANFTVASTQTGVYTITFNPPFVNPPAIVATQCQFDSAPGTPINESPSDGVACPQVTASNATVVTGNSTGAWTARTFSFVAMGSLGS
ncbi:hypothetical protein [Bradyrhizobium sp. HKCCYLS20291]|uniref:hypothetical protein n=1 Tax=Bradyrhizobium sp. HKCCYLS20291 TaxID=3420766 RepID=UPI003EB837FA